VRLSVGIEDVRDIIADIEQAIQAATGKSPACDATTAEAR
jgi:hypothetical protein